ncbi:DNA polymerase III subunit [Flexistipes sp.]|uniref:DNA polymerase III subunit n=1 Tax=Flexistipes sp. TaxID=3088135 RepID=UPI002E1D062B|nr:DNA polymerase III subunit delta' [Flexistipes sp.]
MITGHSREKDIFTNIIKNKSLLNSYIFSGKNGIGKKLFAEELARSALCLEEKAFEDCECSSCTLARQGNNPDIRVVDDDTIKIDRVRDFAADAHISPYFGKYKFFIINNAHLMTRDAANSFLKTLEEPSPTTVFILVTHKEASLLPTIKSRCIEVKFGRLKSEELAYILTQKGYEAAKANSISQVASGSVETAVYLMEQNAESMETFRDMTFENTLTSLMKLKNRDEIKNYVFNLYISILESYKTTYDDTLLNFMNELLLVIKRLEYNINTEMAKMYLLTKAEEVLSEKR